jgi:hypothetical protein
LLKTFTSADYTCIRDVPAANHDYLITCTGHFKCILFLQNFIPVPRARQYFDSSSPRTILTLFSLLGGTSTSYTVIYFYAVLCHLGCVDCCLKFYIYIYIFYNFYILCCKNIPCTEAVHCVQSFCKIFTKGRFPH